MRAVCLHLALVAPLVFSCSNDFERQSQIERVRVLGVRAEPAELVIAASGPMDAPPAVHLDALAVAPQGRAVNVELAFCRPFANVYAADFECPGKDGVDLVDGGLSLADPGVLALFSAALDGGNSSDPFSNPIVDAQLEIGLDLQVGYTATDGTMGEAGIERGFRALKLRRTDQPNHNPGLDDVLFDGGTLDGQTLVAGATVELQPRLTPGSQETFTQGGVEVEEGISLSWFASGDATVLDFRSVFLPGDAGQPDTRLTAPDAGGPTTIWVVARDGRGGTNWLSRTFTSR